MFGRVAASVDERTRLQDEISAQNERLAEAAAIVESTTDSITSVRLDGTILSWNRASERLYGYTAAEMIGERIHKIIEPERHADVDATLKDSRALSPPRPSGKKSEPGTIPTLRSTARRASPVVSTPGTVSHEKNPPRGVVQWARSGMKRWSAASSR